MVSSQQPSIGGSIYERVVEQFDPTRIAFRGNRYFDGANQNPFQVMFLSYGGWLSLSHETNSSYGVVSYPNSLADISTYMALIGSPGQGVREFLSQVRLQRRGYFREEYSAVAAISYLRATFGKP